MVDASFIDTSAGNGHFVLNSLLRARSTSPATVYGARTLMFQQRGRNKGLRVSRNRRVEAVNFRQISSSP